MNFIHRKSDGDSEDIPEGPDGVASTVWSTIWGDATIDERRKFIRILFRGLVIFHVAWACGWLYAPFGLSGFAWSKDVAAIKTSIKSEIDANHAELMRPINKRLDDLSAKVEETLQIQRKILAGQLAAQLRDLNRIRCKTKDDVTRWRIELDMDEAQTSYRTLTGERYPISACKDL